MYSLSMPMVFHKHDRYVADKSTATAGSTTVAADEAADDQPTEAPVLVETQDASLMLVRSDNLLDALLNSGHEIDYQCRGGYCGSCRVKVIQGQVDYDDFPLAHLNHDEILPCCCRVSEPLKLDVKLREVDSEKQGSLFDEKS